MRCTLCRKKLGIMRRLVDGRFCSTDHRRRFIEGRSARALRDTEEYMGYDEHYLHTVRQHEPKPKKRSAFVVFGSIGLALAIFFVVGPFGDTESAQGGLLESVKQSIPQGIKSIIQQPSRPAVQLRSDFQSNVEEWVSAAAASTRPSAGQTKAVNLKLWKPSLHLADYQVEFEGSIDKRAMSWAFRASDLNNYYGAKLIAGGKDGQGAAIERFVFMNGKTLDRTRMPSPVPVRAGDTHQVKMVLKGDHFLTFVDGQVVDSWHDRRFTRGGIGFFSESGESASLKWVNLTDGASTLNRLLAAGLFLPHL